jgi:hypothetical protein
MIEVVETYQICALPSDANELDIEAFSIRVQRRSRETWTVLHGGFALNRHGGWDWEPIPSSRTARWLHQHRFSETEALALARKAAPEVLVNGVRAADYTLKPRNR